MIFMLAVIYIAYRLFTYQPGIPGRKPQDHIRKPYQNEPEKQGKATNSTDDDYIDYEELKWKPGSRQCSRTHRRLGSV